MKKPYKKILSFFLVLVFLFAFTSCKYQETEATETSTVQNTQEKDTSASLEQADASLSQSQYTLTDEPDTTVVLNDDATTVDGTGAAYSKGVLTISLPGTYHLSGKLSDGYIFVNSESKDKKVKLIFDGVEIYSSKSSPVFVASSPKETQIILAQNSVNSLRDNKDRVLSAEEKESDDYSKATVFSKDDLQIEGTGTLNISANFEKGIYSKDDLQIKGGVLNITSADDAIRGKDSLEISNSTIKISAKGDGLRTSLEEENKGDLTVSNSNIEIESDLDGIQSVGTLSLSDSTISIICAHGASDDMTSAPKDMKKGMGGFGNRPDPFSNNSGNENTTPSAKGIKSAKDMTVTNCNITVNSVDDALHSNSSLSLTNSTAEIKTNDDGLHSELYLNIINSTVTATLSYEGLEAQEISVENSVIDITATDDGLNAAAADNQEENPAFSGGNVEKKEPEKPSKFSPKGPNGMGGMGGMDEYNSSCQIKITDSTLCIKAEGDGIDSNGDIEISNSTAVIYGPTNGGNGSLDYAGECKVLSGTVIAAGSNGMAQDVSDGSVPSLYFTCGVKENTLLTITDENSKEIITFSSPKQYSCVVFASDKLEKGKSYTVYTNSTAQNEGMFGIYSGANTENASVLGTVEAS